MVGRTSRVYYYHGERHQARPLHPRWYTERGIADLNERLRAPPVALRFRAIGKSLSAAKGRRLGLESVALAREVMATLFRKTKSLVARHMLNYPFPEIDPVPFATPAGRAASERYLHILRTHDARFRPRRIRASQSVPPIVVLGTSRSAESLRMEALFGPRVALARLENQRGNASADYHLDIAAIGSGTTLALLDYWWDGKDAASEPEIQEAYDTLYHECLHRVCDLSNPFGPQYGPRGGEKEHYWMTEYEPFASNVEDVILDHLSAEQERGLLRKRMLQRKKAR